MDLLKWSKRPAADVEARKPEVNILRGLIARATTPLLPDDYLHLINPLWSARERRGRVVDVIRETEDSATVTIRTGWGSPIRTSRASMWASDCGWVAAGTGGRIH